MQFLQFEGRMEALERRVEDIGGREGDTGRSEEGGRREGTGKQKIRKTLEFHGLPLEKGETGKSLMEKIEDIMEMKMNMNRKIGLRKTTRKSDCNSNAPPVVVIFEEQVRSKYGTKKLKT